MRAVALLVLVALDGSAAPTRAAKAEGRCRFRECVRTRGAIDSRVLALFEFAPPEGYGLTAPCACTAVLGAKGETMTFARASSATCLTGSTFSGIANGDMVTCSSNQPRVMPGGDGSGGSGLLVELDRANAVLHSEEFDDAFWLLGTVGGVSTPTVTANQAVSPKATTTGDRVQFAATTAVQSSHLAAVFAFNAITSGSIFVKGNGTSGTIDLCVNNSPAGTTHDCVACAYVSTSWSRCAVRGVANANANADYAVGNLSFFNGGTARSAADVFLWGAQWEAGKYESSYIPTTTVAVARSEDHAYFAGSWPAPSGWSGAITWVMPAGFSGVQFGFEPSTGVGDRYSLYHSVSGTMSAYIVIGGLLAVNVPKAVSLGAPHRIAEYYDGTNQSVCVDGACASTPVSYVPLTPIDRLTIGNHRIPGDAADGVIKGACFDPSPGKCR